MQMHHCGLANIQWRGAKTFLVNRAQQPSYII